MIISNSKVEFSPNKRSVSSRKKQIAIAAMVGIIGLSAEFKTAQGAAYYWDPAGKNASQGGNGDWLGGAFWNSSSNDANPPVLWSTIQGNDANFGGAAAYNVNVSGGVSVSSIVFNDAAGVTLAQNGAGGSITFTGPTPLINAVAVSKLNSITANISSTSQIAVSGTAANVVNFGGQNTFSNGLDVQAALRVNFNVNGAAGTTNAPLLVEQNATIVSTQNTVAGSNTPGTFVINNPLSIQLNTNPSGSISAYSPGAFVTALGTTTGASGFVTTNYSGPISGNGDVVIGNSVTGGGAGITEFSGNNKTYAGATIVDNTDSTGGFWLGTDNALPATTDLILGNGDTTAVAPVDLRGHNLQVASISTNPGAATSKVPAGGSELGITNSGSTISTLTIGGNGQDLSSTAGTVITYNSIIGASTTISAISGNFSVAGNNNEALVYNSPATLQFQAANTYIGGTTINQGVIQLAGSGSLSAASSLTINAGGTFDINGINQTSLGFNGSGGLLTSSAGSPVTFSANIPTGPVNTFSGVISNGGGIVSLTKSGLGALTLNGTNSYTGNTNVSAGTLRIDAPGSLVNTSISVAANATLGGTGTVGGPVTINSGGILAPGDLTGTFNIGGSLTLSPNADLKFNLTNMPSTSIQVVGGLTVPNSGSNINPVQIDVAGSLTPNTYPLIAFNFNSANNTASGSLTGDLGHLTLHTLPGGYAYSLINPAGSGLVELVVRNLGSTVTWTGASSSVWNTAAANFTPQNYADADPVIFNDGGKQSNITIPSEVDPGPVSFNNSTVAYTITGSPIGGNTTLSVNSGGMATLGSTNVFSGTVSINSGTLSVGSDSYLGNIFNSLVMGTNTSTGTLQATGSFVSNRVFTFAGTSDVDVTGTNNLTLSGILGGAGSLIKSNSGVLTLTGTGNTYQGSTTVSGGSLVAGADDVLPVTTDLTVGAGANFNTGSFTQTVGSISGAGIIVLGASLTTGDALNTSFTGSIIGAGTLIKTGLGNLTLGASNSFGGSGQSVNVNAGTLTVTGDANLGNAANSVTLGDGATLAINGSAFSSSRSFSLTSGTVGSATVNVSGAATINGNITGEALNVTGGGVLNLNGSNSNNALNISGATVAVSNDAALGTGLVTFSNTGTVDPNASFLTQKNFNVGVGGGIISLSGNTLNISTGVFAGPQNTGMTVNGPGSLILAGAGSSYGGAWNITNNAIVDNNSVDSGNKGGIGVGGTTSGQLNSNSIHPSNGGVFQIDNVQLGTSGSTSKVARIYLDSNGTVIGTGQAAYDYQGGGVYVFRNLSAGSPNVVNIGTVAAGDTFSINDEILQVNRPTDSVYYTGVSNAVINVNPQTIAGTVSAGKGTVIIRAGDLSGTSIYAGSWNVQGGILQVGPVIPDLTPLGNTFGPSYEPLNALGFVNGDPDSPNPVTVSAGILAIAVDSPNTNPSFVSSAQAAGLPVNPTPSYLRNSITLAGGGIASTGQEVSYDPNGSGGSGEGVPDGVAVTAQFGGNFDVAAGAVSHVYTYDPSNTVTTPTGMAVSLVGGSRYLSGTNTTITYSTTWAGTLSVDSGETTGGAFEIARTGGTVSVTPGASVIVSSGSQLDCG